MRRLAAVLAAAVVARMTFHALFVPAFEGPDEPYHLARALAFASGPPSRAFAGAPVAPALVDAVRAKPCSENLHRVFGCPLFGASPARFDVLAPDPPAPQAGRSLVNTEDNQPPLAYLLGGLVLRACGAFGGLSPSASLLVFRLFGVLCVAVALFGPLLVLAGDPRRAGGLTVGVLLLLLTPGASEALARASNDAPVFLWAALCVWAIKRRFGAAVLIPLLAAGPLLKLTALPVAVFAVAALADRGRPRLALAGAAATLAVFPVQALRGWKWGGTLEFNAAATALVGSAGATLVGLLRSSYTLIKTTFWLGEWSFFRAPRPLVAAYFLILAAALLLAGRRPDPHHRAAHAAGAVVAAGGFLAFAIGNRLYYGDWGGVGGWYVWTWLPWLAMAASDLAVMPRRAATGVLVALAVFVVVANVLWLSVAWPLYG
ncbi:MAG TPA: DUF2142 domain-containing protein [Thermoanaerobaculia bacterium]